MLCCIEQEIEMDNLKQADELSNMERVKEKQMLTHSKCNNRKITTFQLNFRIVLSKDIATVATNQPFFKRQNDSVCEFKSLA